MAAFLIGLFMPKAQAGVPLRKTHMPSSWISAAQITPVIKDHMLGMWSVVFPNLVVPINGCVTMNTCHLSDHPALLED